MYQYRRKLGDDGNRERATTSAEYVFKPRGLKPFAECRVTYDSLASASTVSGLQLRRDGLPVRLENAGMSELLLLELL